MIVFTPLALLCDQITKQMIHSALEPFEEIVIIPGHLEFILVRNSGLVFGMFSGRLGGTATLIFLGITVIALGIIIHLFFHTENKAVVLPLALSLVLAGAFGNLIDRLRWGYVVDFINMHAHLLGKERTWPTFNIADLAITGGIVLLVIDAFKPQFIWLFNLISGRKSEEQGSGAE